MALYSGLDLYFLPYSGHRWFTSPSKRAAESVTPQPLGVSRTRIPECMCKKWPFRPHFAGARAKGKRNCKNIWQRLTSELSARQSPISHLICQMSPLFWSIFDRRHVHDSHAVALTKRYGQYQRRTKGSDFVLTETMVSICAVCDQWMGNENWERFSA